MSKIAEVAVVVINYNGRKWLQRCLSSLVKTNYPNFSMYLVDNASTDGSPEYVRASFPQVKIIRHEKNLGFAGGYNRAIMQINADYIVLLNNDTEILEPNWIAVMVRVADEDRLIAAVACKMVFMSDPAIINSVGGVGIPYWRGFEDIGFGERDTEQYDKPPIEPFSFCGGASLIRTEAFREAGGFDESFFAYFEDTDLSWRLRMRGYRIAYAPSAKIVHYFSGTWLDSPEKPYLCKRNLLRSILKNCNGWVLRWAIRDYLLFVFLTSISYLKVEHAPVMSWMFIKGVLWNLRHLPSTLRERAVAQKARKTSDEQIIRAMYPLGLATWRRGESFGAKLGDTAFGYPLESQHSHKR